MTAQHHLNNGNCPKCEDLFNRYPDFHPGLKEWFKALQKKRPDSHISCAGRGAVDQEACFKAGTSKAHYGQSSHNYNCAVDLFRLTEAGASWDRPWFRDVVGTAVFTHNSNPNQFAIEWYGAPHAVFFELPHVQVASWRELNRQLVEPIPPVSSEA